MRKIFFIGLFVFINAFGFETASGTYISQQDLIQSIKQLFYGSADLKNFSTYLLTGCITYKEPFDSKDLYELGFINLESGERMVQEPDSSYVLYLDTCITKVSKTRLAEYDSKFITMIFGDSLFAELNQERAKFQSLLSAYVAAGGSSTVDTSVFETLSGKFFETVPVKTMPISVREKMIERIFVYSFGGDDLVPKEYYDLAKAQLLAMSADTMTMEVFVANVFKKALINDYFLKY